MFLCKSAENDKANDKQDRTIALLLLSSLESEEMVLPSLYQRPSIQDKEKATINPVNVSGDFLKVQDIWNHPADQQVK